MRDGNEEYWEVIKGVIGALIVLAIFIIFFLTGCNFKSLFDKQKSEQGKDSISVKKESESLNKVDTSKSKSESTNTKETVYYPQPIYIQGKDGKTEVVFVPQTVKETGTEKEEKQNYNFEDWRRHFTDSLQMAEIKKELDKKSDTQGSVLSAGQLIGIALIGVVLIGIVFMAIHFKNQITSIKNLITKT